MNTTGLARTVATPRDWRTSAACRSIADEELFSKLPTVQARVLRVCKLCPVRSSCLTNAQTLEADEYMLWGIAGGLTDSQRRALRVERLLGNTPNLKQAQVLASPVFDEFMREWRQWPASTVAVELRRNGVIASPVTVRVALWWTGGPAGLLLPQTDGDTRSPQERVRDEFRQLVADLRELGVGNRDIAGYLGVTRDALEKAVKSWRAEAAQAVAA